MQHEVNTVQYHFQSFLWENEIHKTELKFIDDVGIIYI